MFEYLKNNIKPIIIQSFMVLVFFILSFISLFFNEWVIILNMAICSLLSLGNVVLFIISKKIINENRHQLSFALFTLLRYLLMIVGLAFSAVMIMITMPSEVDNLRYLFILITSLPFVATVFSLMVDK